MTTSSFDVKRTEEKNVFCRTGTAVVGRQVSEEIVQLFSTMLHV